MNSALLSTLRGGQTEWLVDFSHDGVQYYRYDSLVISVSGITKSITFDGSLQGCTPLVVIQRWNLVEHVPGDSVQIGIRDILLGENKWIWKGRIADVDKTSDSSITVTCTGALSSIAQEQEVYYSEADSARGMAGRMMSQWISGLSSTPPAWTDSYYRNAARLSSPYSTLGGLDGIATQGTVTYYGWTTSGARSQNPDGTIMTNQTSGRISRTGSLTPSMLEMSNWGIGNPDGTYTFEPLQMHRRDVSLNLCGLYGDNPNFNTKINWLTGEYKFFCVWLKINIGDPMISTTTDALFPAIACFNRNQVIQKIFTGEKTWAHRPLRRVFETKEVSVVQPPIVRTSWQSAAMSAMGVSYTATGEEVDRLTCGSKVLGQLHSFAYTDENSAPIVKIITDVSTAASGAEYIGVSADELKRIRDKSPSSRTAHERSALAPYQKNPLTTLEGNFAFNAVNLTSDFSSSSSFVSDCYCVEFMQEVQPVTIASTTYTYKDYGAELLELSSLGVFEGATGPVWADTCPETGSVFDIPLTDDFISSFSFKTNNWLPANITVNVRDMLATDHSITTTLEEATGNGNTQTRQYNLMQGQVGVKEGAQSLYFPYGTHPGYWMTCNNWNSSPGVMFDRWTGMAIERGAYSPIFVNDSQDQCGLCLLCEGGVKARLYDNVAGSTIQAASDYETHDKNNLVRRLFFENNASTGASAPGFHAWETLPVNKKAPYVDIFPVMALKKAVHRVFANPARPVYSVTCAPCFAAVNPGRIIYIKYSGFMGGTAYLAMVMSVSIADNLTTTLEIAPMRPASEYTSDQFDYSRPASVILQKTSGTQPSPHRVYSNNTQVTRYDRYFKITGVSTWGGEQWWYPLQRNGQDVAIPLTPNANVFIHAENSRTGYKSDWIITREDWINAHLDYGQWNERKGLMKGLSNAIFGRDDYGTGLIFYQNWWNPQAANIVFNSDVLPDLSDWIIEFSWDNAAPIVYYDAYDRGTGWLHTSAYSYTSSAAQSVVGWKDAADRVALLFTGQSGSITMLPCTSRTSASDTLNYFYFQLPADGVYSEMRASINRAQTTSFRFTIASTFRDGYPSNSTFAGDIFGDDYKPLSGAKIELIKWRY